MRIAAFFLRHFVWRVSKSLHIAEALVVAFEFQQFVVFAAFDDASLVHHANFVGLTNGGQTVRHNDGCAILHQIFERALHQAFAFGIECRSGFVENQNRRIAQDGACDADALPLSAREPTAAVADVGFVALLGSHDKVVRIGNFGCGHHFVHRGRLDAKGDVVEKYIIEQNHLLIDIAHQQAQRLQVEVRDVGAIDRDAALIDIVEARNKIDQRGFARPRLPHQSDGLAFGTHQIDVFQNPIFAVFEPNVVEANFGVKLVDFERVILLFQRVVGFQHVIDTLQRGHAFLNAVHGFRQIFARRDDAVKNDQIVDKFGCRDTALPVQNERPAVPQQDGHHASAEKFADRMRQQITAVDAVERAANALVEFASAVKALTTRSPPKVSSICDKSSPVCCCPLSDRRLSDRPILPMRKPLNGSNSSTNNVSFQLKANSTPK